ncbi:hypothetical protein LXL04_005409 [Taraxacum kok-saghyz]
MVVAKVIQEEQAARFSEFGDVNGGNFEFSLVLSDEEGTERGRRLANYAKTFNVPFKFKAIAKKWETITIHDLELDPDETLIVNCAYRFREALVFFSSLFDMIEANVGREVQERMLIEKGIWEAMNVIACEGGERIARPLTYKQWQVRNLRAGFRQL